MLTIVTTEYIKGFFDGEGCVYSNKRRRKGHRCLIITNTEKQILEEISKFLTSIDIENNLCLHSKGGRVYTKSNGSTEITKDCYRIWIFGMRNIKKYGELIGFSHKEKIAQYEEILKLYDECIKYRPNVWNRKV